MFDQDECVVIVKSLQRKQDRTCAWSACMILYDLVMMSWCHDMILRNCWGSSNPTCFEGAYRRKALLGHPLWFRKQPSQTGQNVHVWRCSDFLGTMGWNYKLTPVDCQALPVNLVGPVNPVWCPVPKPSQPSCPKRGEVDFIGKWFLQEVQMTKKHAKNRGHWGKSRWFKMYNITFLINFPTDLANFTFLLTYDFHDLLLLVVPKRQEGHPGLQFDIDCQQWFLPGTWSIATRADGRKNRGDRGGGGGGVVFFWMLARQQDTQYINKSCFIVSCLYEVIWSNVQTRCARY